MIAIDMIIKHIPSTNPITKMFKTELHVYKRASLGEG